MFGILSGGIRSAKARRICRRQCPIRYSLWPAQCRTGTRRGESRPEAIRRLVGKLVGAFCGEADFDTASLSSNTFEIEWPPKSGRRQSFPEIDRAEWFDLESARSKILSGQIELIDRFEKVGL
jgi:hypothetical protein